MENINRPPKPNLEYQYHREGNVTVKSLTPESELLWSNYLREDHFALQALYRSLHAEKQEEVSDS